MVNKNATVYTNILYVCQMSLLLTFDAPIQPY